MAIIHWHENHNDGFWEVSSCHFGMVGKKAFKHWTLRLDEITIQNMFLQHLFFFFFFFLRKRQSWLEVFIYVDNVFLVQFVIPQYPPKKEFQIGLLLIALLLFSGWLLLCGINRCDRYMDEIRLQYFYIYCFPIHFKI